MAIFGYIRVSTSNKGQTTDNQRKLIEDAGFKVDNWVDELGISGSMDAQDRPGFKKMMQKLQEGDTIITVAIDRLGRSASDVLNTVDYLKVKGVKLRVLSLDGVDLTSPTGRLLITLLAAVAEMEKNLIVERVHAGLSRCKAEGRIFGKPLQVAPETIEKIVAEFSQGMTVLQASLKYNLSTKTITSYRKTYYNKPQAIQEYAERYEKQALQIKLNKEK
jgi:DNA invertase Pin-like site-specific DNA recombinase